MNAPLHPADTLQEEDLARADAYAVLARVLFEAPDAGLLDALHHATRDGEGALASSWNAMCAAAVDAAAIEEEFNSLFVGIGRPQVELHGSWYLTGFLMEKPLALLRDDLQTLGLARNDESLEAEDHIAGVLDVMRHLVLSGGGMAMSDSVFFKRHIADWYAKLCDAMVAAPEACFYKAVSVFMRAFLDMERDFFALQFDRDGGVK